VKTLETVENRQVSGYESMLSRVSANIYSSLYPIETSVDPSNLQRLYPNISKTVGNKKPGLSSQHNVSFDLECNF
jgi:hypothetical protein